MSLVHLKIDFQFGDYEIMAQKPPRGDASF